MMNSADYKYLLFDLDGTLVDSVADLTTSLNLLADELGHPHLPPEHVRTIVGDGATKLIKRAYGEENYQREQLFRFLAIYGEHLLDHTCCYQGIEELLQSHPADRMALVTNKPHSLTIELLEGLGIARHFKVIFGGDSFAEKKPHPLPVQRALTALGADPAQAVMIGDHHTDLHSGKGAGTATCFCAYGLGHTGGLEPDFQVTASTELIKLFPGTGK
ncbi:HAD family hydrolase [Malonomonas rubra]|uniref:HAD family hydrolase n=1 Tax=Malonomonas rubra TaxID=57040 RepID=UPI0026F34A91|nr:HAD-IA family hydrolase [Malonomonas rubra]